MPIMHSQPNSKIIGLTGSIGSGKSTVAELFASWGSRIVDFDQIGRSLISTDPRVILSIKELFGSQVLRPDLSVDRFALRSLIFANNNAKQQLEKLLHPAIRSFAQKEIQNLLHAGSDSITVVIPLLFENATRFEGLSCTVLVSSSRDLCIQRASSRDFCNSKLIASIYDLQMPEEKKKELADYIIDNSEDLDSLVRNSKKTYEFIHSN
jgi:dephospho-CoA kinase